MTWRNPRAAAFAAIVALAYADMRPANAAGGQSAAVAPTTAVSAPAGAATTAGDYVIGPNDQLSIVFWREKDLSADVVVRPDGKISLPLLNDVEASGLTPEQLRHRLVEAASRYVEAPNATVLVKEIGSRRVFITGMVQSPGAYLLTTPTTVLQLIATAGGLLEYANSRKIVVFRRVNGRQVSYTFNYKDVMERRNIEQDIDLQPGDTVVVP